MNIATAYAALTEQRAYRRRVAAFGPVAAVAPYHGALPQPPRGRIPAQRVPASSPSSVAA